MNAGARRVYGGKPPRRHAARPDRPTASFCGFVLSVDLGEPWDPDHPDACDLCARATHA